MNDLSHTLFPEQNVEDPLAFDAHLASRRAPLIHLTDVRLLEAFDRLVWVGLRETRVTKRTDRGTDHVEWPRARTHEAFDQNAIELTQDQPFRPARRADESREEIGVESRFQ